MAFAAIYQLLAVWMLVTSDTFWQNILVFGFSRNIAVYLQVAFPAFHMSMSGSC